MTKFIYMLKIYIKQSNKQKSLVLKLLNDSKTFIEHSNYMDDIYKKYWRTQPNKERKMLIVFHGLISDMLINKKLNPIVNELVITGRKLNISPILLHNPILLYQKILH